MCFVGALSPMGFCLDGHVGENNKFHFLGLLRSSVFLKE